MYPVFCISGILIPTFPLIIMLAFFVCMLIYIRSGKYNKFYIFSVFRMSINTLLGAAIGGRIFSAVILTMNSNRIFWENLIYGGSVFYGGVIGGMLVIYVSCQHEKIAILDFMDVFSSLLPLGHAIGRIGCYLNGCCYGKAYTGLFSVRYIIEGERLYVFPTWFVEAAYNMLVFWGINIYIPNIRGLYTAVYLISYSIFRFIIEFWRGDEIRGKLWYLSTSQMISLLMLFLGSYILRKSLKVRMKNCMLEKE